MQILNLFLILLSFSSYCMKLAKTKHSTSEEKVLFVAELLRELQDGDNNDQDASILLAKSHRLVIETNSSSSFSSYLAQTTNTKQNNNSLRQTIDKQLVITQLIDALDSSSTAADVRRVADWLKSWFSVASFGEMSTQLIVGKLAAVNCGALFKPNFKLSAQIMPRFLLFNERFVDVPFELTVNSTRDEILNEAYFDLRRQTIVILHGFLGGYALTDNLSNIKNSLLDVSASASSTSDKYNVIIVDWFRGANPEPRASYVRAAANAQIIGKQLADFLANLASQANAQMKLVHVIAHSLG